MLYQYQFTYFIITHFIFQTWLDTRLAWDPEDYNGIDHTSIASDSIWIPEIELMNQDELMNNGIEHPYSPKIHHTGKVELQRQMRSKTTCNTYVANYPLDDQQCNVVFASNHNPTDILQMTVQRWNKKNRLPKDLTQTEFSDTHLNMIQHQYWESNAEWTLTGYRYISLDIAATSGQGSK